jgi:hypothetical protein
MNANFKCQIESFDPFYVSDSKLVTKKNSIGWIAKFEDILEYTQLTNKTIDIEYNEWNVLMTLDMEYACKYIKQFMLETHPARILSPDQRRDFNSLKLLRRLEKCFLLFHRDTRFF